MRGIASSKHQGFTIIEIAVVIFIIAILVMITLFGTNEYRKQASFARAKHEIQQIESAVRTARQNKGGVTMTDITGTTWTARGCSTAMANYGGNTAKLEPKYLSRSHACWTDYYSALDKISAASGINLSNLKKGDPYGNPYILDENEGEFPTRPCEEDFLSMVIPGTYIYFTKVAHVNEDASFDNNDPYNVAQYIALAKPPVGC